MADQSAPIGELRKDFDRLRTVLFERLRTQSSNFNYTGECDPSAWSGVEPREAYASRRTPAKGRGVHGTLIWKRRSRFESGNQRGAVAVLRGRNFLDLTVEHARKAHQHF
jgi:hypothetical protein